MKEKLYRITFQIQFHFTMTIDKKVRRRAEKTEGWKIECDNENEWERLNDTSQVSSQQVKFFMFFCSQMCFSAENFIFLGQCSLKVQCCVKFCGCR